MGCVSSNLLNHDDDFSHLGSTALGHHIVSLTSTTYGLLTLDPQPPHSSTPTPSRFTLPEVINSWELMAGLDTTESFRFDNSHPNLLTKPAPPSSRFQRICPPNGENRVVIYTTTLRGVRRTFEACNAVRAAFQAFGVLFCERDVSMDSGFKEELRMLFKGKGKDASMTMVVPPKVFVKGFYIGGAEEMLKVAEEGLLGELLQGLPRKPIVGAVCEGCGDLRFLPCFSCNGSCKIVKAHKEGSTRNIVVKCNDCNENGLVLCPVCS